jgi:hypothetical protein
MLKPKYAPHPQSAPGDFYVIHNECLTCGMPQVAAPELVGWTKDNGHCIWTKQPETAEELEHAIRVLETQDLGCHRYAGSDPIVLERVPECCDDPAARPLRYTPLIESLRFRTPQQSLFVRMWRNLTRKH